MRVRKCLAWGLMIGMLLGSSGYAQGPGTDASSGFCRTEGRWVLDEQGRVILLRGVNLADGAKELSTGFLPRQTREEILGLRKLGCNSVRYLIIWEGVEPEPGQYNEAYLDQVAERLAWCKEAGLRVILDMHQDLYSRKYSADGAPEWACLDDGIPFVITPGGWFMNYAAPSVIRAFDNFWANKPGPGGVGIQDRYIAMWQHVAERFKNDTNLLGYDGMNEPFYGSGVLGMFGSLLIAAASELGEEGVDLSQTTQGPEGTEKMIKAAVEKLIAEDKLLTVFDRASFLSERFDRKILQPFYNRWASAMREVDPHHILVFEPTGGASTGTRILTAIDVPKDAQGKPFANCIFSPHHYELSTDLGFQYDPASRLVSRGLARGAQAAQRMSVPVWYGEWGAWTGSKPGTNELILDHLNAYDDLLCGWAYWAYGRGFENEPFIPQFSRPYAQVIAGRPQSMKCGTERFELIFDPLPEGGETIIWVHPNTPAQVTLEGTPAGTTERDERGVRVMLPPGSPRSTVKMALSGTL